LYILAIVPHGGKRLNNDLKMVAEDYEEIVEKVLGFRREKE